MTTDTTHPYGLRNAAIAAYQERERKLEQERQERDARERDSLLGEFRGYIERYLSVPLDAAVDVTIEGSMVYFEIDGLHLAYRNWVNDYRFNQQLYLGLPCPNAVAAVEHTLVYDRFDSGIEGLGRALEQLVGSMPCFKCQERAEELNDRTRDDTPVRPRPLNAIEHLTLAMRQIAEEVVQERTGA